MNAQIERDRIWADKERERKEDEAKAKLMASMERDRLWAEHEIDLKNRKHQANYDYEMKVMEDRMRMQGLSKNYELAKSIIAEMKEWNNFKTWAKYCDCLCVFFIVVVHRFSILDSHDVYIGISVVNP